MEELVELLAHALVLGAGGLGLVDRGLGLVDAIGSSGHGGGDGLAGRCGHALGGAVLLALLAGLVRAHREDVVAGCDQEQRGDGGHCDQHALTHAEKILGGDGDHEHTPGPQLAYSGSKRWRINTGYC